MGKVLSALAADQGRLPGGGVFLDKHPIAAAEHTVGWRRQSPLWGHPGLMEEIRSVAWERPHV